MTTTISAAMVKQLREMTGAGLMDCKKALVETAADLDAAADLLRKNLALKATKRAGRIAAEGAIEIAVSDDAKMAIMCEVNSETDFVSRHKDFLNFTQQLAARALAERCDSIEGILALPVAQGETQTFEELRQELVSQTGENIQLRRVVLVNVDEGVVGAYCHGGRLGALVSLSDNQDVAKEIAMHVTAANPQAIDEADMDQALIAKEKAFYVEQAQESGKPADIIEKMVEGKVAKFVKENCLLSQPFVKNPDQTVAVLLSDANASLSAFHRYELGEGIEKPVTDFAQEVREQAKGG